MTARDIFAFLRGDTEAARVVPRAGFTVWLTLFSAGAMAFLAVFALALSLAAGRLADRWGSELAQGATLRITAPADQLEAQTAAALKLLSSTRGVAAARALTDDEQAALLAPWFGTDLPLGDLPVPRLIEISENGDGFDAEGLRLRLAAELPGAMLDDHARWRAPLERGARGLRRLGTLALLLIAITTGAIVTLAAQAALAANEQVITVLRLVGATDRYISRAFERRFTLRALGGAAAGTALALLAILALPRAEGMDGLLTGLAFQGGQWLLPLLIAPLAALVAWGATTIAARRMLASLA